VNPIRTPKQHLREADRLAMLAAVDQLLVLIREKRAAERGERLQ
jgi:hypothetical protein